MRLLDAKLLKEETKVMSKVDIVRVPKDLIEPILQHVSHVTDISREDMHLVGSTGKAKVSGDVDIAVDANKYTPFRIHEKLLKRVGEENGVYNKGTNVGSYAIPLRSGERVQVDLMFVDNVEWAKFAYYSAGDQSEYKGAVRAILLSAVAASLDEEGVDAFHYIDDQLIVRVGRGIDPNKGLKRLFQMRPHKKYGEGYTKGLKNTSPDEIKRLYPKLNFDDNDIVIDDPQKVVEILFGPGTRLANVDTTEEVIDLINRFPPKQRNKIFDIAKMRARALAAKGFALPEEIS